MSELFCKVPQSGVPDPNVSGLERSERIASISTRLRAFFPHFQRVYEQQSELQPPTNTLLGQLGSVRAHSRNLAGVVSSLYQNLYPNQPGPGPEGGPPTLSPSQNTFQQKVYGCAVLRTYKEFLSNATRELRTLKSEACAGGLQRSGRLL